MIGLKLLYTTGNASYRNALSGLSNRKAGAKRGNVRSKLESEVVLAAVLDLERSKWHENATKLTR